MNTNLCIACCVVLIGCSGNALFNSQELNGKEAITLSSADYNYPVGLKSFPTPRLKLGDVYLWRVDDPNAVLEFAGEIGGAVEEVTVAPVDPNKPDVVNFTFKTNDSIDKMMIDSYTAEHTWLVDQNDGKEPLELPFKLGKAKADISAYRYVVISGFQGKIEFSEKFKTNDGSDGYISSDEIALDKKTFNTQLEDFIKYDCRNTSGPSAHCSFQLKIFEPSLTSGADGTFFGLRPSVGLSSSSVKIRFKRTFKK